MTGQELNKELDFKKKKEDFLRFLAANENGIMVLATSYQDRVLARNVLIAPQGLDIYFFTWKRSRKCQQIRGNSRVALCKDRVQIEGTAEILGGLGNESNTAYVDAFRDKFPEAIERWQDRPGMVIVRIRPTSVVIAGSGDTPFLEFLDLENETAHAETWAYYEAKERNDGSREDP
jgi:general stress protein 26